MARRRFYAPPDNIDGSAITLSPHETHHLIQVLRLTPGDEVFVFDGCGAEYRCSFRRVENDRAHLEIAEPLSDLVDSPLDLSLAQALAKGDKFDFIVQKATELGVSRIVPLVTRYADVRLDEQQKPKRVERWRRISLEAMKQCGRRRLVEIAEPLTIRQLISTQENAGVSGSGIRRAMLVFSERGGLSVHDALAGVKMPCAVFALIGPEGGWSDDELEALNDHGCKAVTLGPRVLRTETAALVGLTLIQHELGDLSPRTNEQTDVT